MTGFNGLICFSFLLRDACSSDTKGTNPSSILLESVIAKIGNWIGNR
jgi:hypothetical protein